MPSRDITKTYSNAAFVEKLRRLADSIESGENFRIFIAGKDIYVPNRAKFSVEHEQGEGSNEIEFQIAWEDEKD
jgi:amphi-Trp domain-containing protein